MKETELVLTLREVMSWDYYVPDHYFDSQMMLLRKEQAKHAEEYTVPMKTFWKPILFEEYHEEDLLNPKFAMRIRDFKDEGDDESGLGGALVSYLRPHDNRQPSDYVKFDKYFSKGEWAQHHKINEVHEVIKEKNTRVNRDYKGFF